MFLITFETSYKINLIKLLRHLTGLGLRDAKDMMEQGCLLQAGQIGSFLERLALEAERDDFRVLIAERLTPIPYTTTIRPFRRVPAPVELPLAVFPTY